MKSVLDIHVHDMHSDRMKTLAHHMQDLNMTDAALAALVGCDRSMITRIRNGTATPSLSLAVAIGKHTGVSIEKLLPVTEVVK